MPITPTYPGIYIEELPSSAHTITAATACRTAETTPPSIITVQGSIHPRTLK